MVAPEKYARSARSDAGRGDAVAFLEYPDVIGAARHSHTSLSGCWDFISLVSVVRVLRVK